MRPQTRAKAALDAWMDDATRHKDESELYHVTEAIIDAEDDAYLRAAEVVVNCGHISSDLAKQRILALLNKPERVEESELLRDG